MKSQFSRFLLIDISNSYTKIARSSRAKIGAVRRVPTRTLTADRLKKIIGKLSFETAVVSSVVPRRAIIIEKFLRGRNVIKVNAKSDLGVGIDYPNPASIGADRLANAASAVALFGAPVVVVDFGTAVTFDIISSNKKYVGGVIAPGLEAMTDYLYQRTALLPKISLREPVSAIGRSTRAAMLSGAVIGYRGLIKEVLRAIKAELSPKRKMRVVATGGYADLIAANLPEIDVLHPHLTLEGLRIIGILNSRSRVNQDRASVRHRPAIASGQARQRAAAHLPSRA